MTSTFQQLETKRLILRQLEQKDGKEILFLRSDKTVNTYVKRPETHTLKDAVAFINKINKGIEEQDWLFWGITLKDTITLIGTICLWNFSEDHKTAEIGYDLHPDFHGQGIMNEAMVCILDYGFDKLILHQIEAYTHKNNEASKNLLVKNNFNHIEHRVDKENENNIIFILQKNNIINTSS